MRERINSAHVLALIAIVLALGGNAVAFTLGKNSVGSKQLKKNAVTAKKIKKNAVTTAKIKKQAVTAAKVKNGTLTGNQINASTLGTVPSAQQANALSAPEGWHEVGASGEPGFQNGWSNIPSSSADTAGFFKDHEGIVHLKGSLATGSSQIIFNLPPGFRPPSGKLIRIAAVCTGGTCDGATALLIFGPNVLPGYDGAVLGSLNGTSISLEGVSFRAES